MAMSSSDTPKLKPWEDDGEEEIKLEEKWLTQVQKMWRDGIN